MQTQSLLILKYGDTDWNRGAHLSVEAALDRDSRSISSCSTLRSISSSASGLDVISIFSFAAASSTCGLAVL